MRARSLALTMLLALPALPAPGAPGAPRSAAATEQIRLEHIQAAEVVRWLDEAWLADQGVRPERQEPVPGLPAPGDTSPFRATGLPSGLYAWTVDAGKNSLAITGSPDGIRELQSWLRLLDIPVRRVRLSVRVVRPDAARLAQLKRLLPDLNREQLPGSGDRGEAMASAFDRKLLPEIEALPVLIASEMEVANNRPVYLRWPGDSPGGTKDAKDAGAAAGPVVAAVLPRVNGDGTVTLQVWLKTFDKSGAAPMTMLRRVAAGEGILVAPHAAQPALVVTVREQGQESGGSARSN